MTIYFKTMLSPQIVKPFIRNSMLFYSSFYTTKNVNVDLYLKRNYDVSIEDVLIGFIKNLKVNRVKDTLLQIYCDNHSYIKGRNLNELISFLEYGNLEIQPPKIMFKFLNSSLKRTKNILGGY